MNSSKITAIQRWSRFTVLFSSYYQSFPISTSACCLVIKVCLKSEFSLTLPSRPTTSRMPSQPCQVTGLLPLNLTHTCVHRTVLALAYATLYADISLPLDSKRECLLCTCTTESLNLYHCISLCNSVVRRAVNPCFTEGDSKVHGG